MSRYAGCLARRHYSDVQGIVEFFGGAALRYHYFFVQLEHVLANRERSMGDAETLDPRDSEGQGRAKGCLSVESERVATVQDGDPVEGELQRHVPEIVQRDHGIGRPAGYQDERDDERFAAIQGDVDAARRTVTGSVRDGHLHAIIGQR